MRDIIVLMLRKQPGRAVAVIAVVVACAATACSDETPPPIVVADRVVTVQNQTRDRWTGVRVWLNDHYVAGTPALEPGQRLTVQQRDFVAAMGQKFDPSRQSPYGVLVTATSRTGDVRLVWGTPYRRQ